MAMNQRTMRPRASSVSYHAEALAWKTAAEANGGTVSTPTLAAVSTFCTAIDAAGIRDKFIRLNLLCGGFGGNLAAVRTPLYRGATIGGTGGLELDDNYGPFVDTDYNESTGLNGNGSTKCLDTGWTIDGLFSSGMQYNNVHLMVYRQNAISESFFAIPIGGYFGAGSVGLLIQQGSSTCQFYSGDYQGDYALYGSSASSAGMYLAQIDSAPEGTLLRNNQSIKTSQNLGVATSFNDIGSRVLVFAAHNSDYVLGTDPSAINSPLTGRLSAYSIGKAFTSTAQRTAYYNAMLAFQAALGRNV